MAKEFQSLFNGLQLLTIFEEMFSERNVSVKPTLDHIKTFLVIATASTLDEKIELRSLSGPKSVMAPMSQTKLHRITSVFKEMGLVITPEGEYDSRLHTVELTTKGLELARQVGHLFETDVQQSRGWMHAIDDLLTETQGMAFHRREVTKNMQNMLTAAREQLDWKKELKDTLNRKGIPDAEVGTNYVKTLRPDGSVRGAVSHKVLFKRTNTSNLTDLVVEFDSLDYDTLDEILTPNVKFRDVSSNAAAELKNMMDMYSSAAIQENPALRNQYTLLTAQVAREAKSANK